MAKTYAEKLLDPRWQRKRLEMFQRDNWTCTKCGSKTNTLHLHHEGYKGEPWECPNHLLKTVCDGCHLEIHGKSKDNNRYAEPIKVGELLRVSPVWGMEKKELTFELQETPTEIKELESRRGDLADQLRDPEADTEAIMKRIIEIDTNLKTLRRKNGRG